MHAGRKLTQIPAAPASSIPRLWVTADRPAGESDHVHTARATAATSAIWQISGWKP